MVVAVVAAQNAHKVAKITAQLHVDLLVQEDALWIVMQSVQLFVQHYARDVLLHVWGVVLAVVVSVLATAMGAHLNAHLSVREVAALAVRLDVAIVVLVVV